MQTLGKWYSTRRQYWNYNLWQSYFLSARVWDFIMAKPERSSDLWKSLILWSMKGKTNRKIYNAFHVLKNGIKGSLLRWVDGYGSLANITFYVQIKNSTSFLKCRIKFKYNIKKIKTCQLQFFGGNLIFKMFNPTLKYINSNYVLMSLFFYWYYNIFILERVFYI